MPRDQPGDDRSGRRPDDGSGTDQREREQRESRSRVAGWFANTALRTGVALVGFALFLFALGQAVGFDLLGLFVEALGSRTGRWLVVAIFGLLLIAIAQRGFRSAFTSG